MPTKFQYDVFPSQNQADKPRVRRLAERLRAAGLRVWFDEWIIQPGDDIYLAIERGLEAARVQVLCLSPAALGSEWVGLERSTVGRGNLLFRDPDNPGRRLIPLLSADCQLVVARWNARSTCVSGKDQLTEPDRPKRICHRTKQPLLLTKLDCGQHVIPRR